MTNEQRKRIHDITYSTDDRMELAERIVELEDENAKLREYAKLLAVNLEARGCYYCPYEDEYEACDFGAVPNRGCKAYRELRELGVLGE